MKRLFSMSRDLIVIVVLFVLLFAFVYMYFLKQIQRDQKTQKIKMRKWSEEVKQIEKLHERQKQWMTQNLFTHHDDGFFVSFLSDSVTQSGGKIMSISPDKRFVEEEDSLSSNLFLLKRYRVEVQVNYENVKQIFQVFSDSSFLVELNDFTLDRIGEWTKDMTKESIYSPLLLLKCSVTFYCMTVSHLKEVQAS